jgi:DNA invertase Pin-like site-specific DNA recombinase
VSTDKQDLENQRFEIERFCQQRGYVVDQWDQEVVSGTIKVKDRKLSEVLDQLDTGDTLIVSEVSRLSRKLSTILVTIEGLVERGVKVVSVKEGMVFDGGLNSQIIAMAFGLAAQIERSLISARTKEALARKRAEGVQLGRPVGSSKPEKLKLHGQDERILRYMDRHVPMAVIARLLDVNVKTLQSYVERQGLRRLNLLRQLEKTGV